MSLSNCSRSFRSPPSRAQEHHRSSSLLEKQQQSSGKADAAEGGRRLDGMLALSVGSVSQVRSCVLGAAILVTLYFLLQSFHVGPHEIEHKSLQVFSHFAPEAWRSHTPRITKVTSLAGQDNELYEAAIRSHEEHDRVHGYDLKVLREKIVDGYWSKTTYVLSVLVEELAKPADERAEWLMWFGPDTILLNPQIPLEIFLPPSDFKNVHFLGTHDQDGFNDGVFFLHVSDWSVQVLLDALSVPSNHPSLNPDGDKAQHSLQMVLTHDRFRENVFYQPRTWYNAYQLSTDTSEARKGDLLVHFHDLGGDRWSAMSRTLEQLARRGSDGWSVPLEDTTYELQVFEYWQRMRVSRELLERAKAKMHEHEVEGAVRRLQYASTYEMDVADAMNHALDNLKDALGIREGETIA